MMNLIEFQEIASTAWADGKSDFQRQVEAVTGQEAEPKPVNRCRIWAVGGGALPLREDAERCALCGRDDRWMLENDDNPVWVCEWDCEEHAPISSGRFGIRQVDSRRDIEITHYEIVDEEE